MENVESRYSVYKITSPSGRVYIGQTKDVKKRFTSYRNCKPTQALIRRSIMKYGYNEHTFEILLEDLTKTEADDNEIQLIKSFKDEKISLNIADGGYTDIGASRKRAVVKLTLEGEYLDEYTSVTDAGKSVETSASTIGRALKTHGYSSGFLWEYKDNYTPDYQVRWVQRFHIEENKPIYKFDNDGNVLGSYSTLKEAAQSNNVPPSTIRKCLENINSQTKGFRYSHLETCPVYEHPNAKKVRQYTLDGEFIQEFKSSREACKVLGITKCTLTNKTKRPHKIKPIYPYTFKFVEND